jgi:AcrR family transcriptional regulator
MRTRKSTLRPQALSVLSSLFEFMPTRAQRRMVEILEGAIRNYATIGVEKTTYDSIAKACKISRPLVQHYFKDKDAIYEMSMKYIRANFQKLAVDAIKKSSDPATQLEQYVSALFAWAKKYPLHAKVWNLVYYYAAVDSHLKRINTDLVMMGHDRITALLTAGVESGVFADGEIRARAKMIQMLYTGALVSVSSEDLYIDVEEFRKLLVRSCLQLAIQPLPRQ